MNLKFLISNINPVCLNIFIAFVSFTELNQETIALSASVNGHIRSCRQCRKLVDAFQLLYDAFTKQGSTGSFKQYALQALQQEAQQNAEEAEFFR